MAMRSIPYVPAFAITPERTAVTSAGASRYASGSQPWNGNSGALIRNANMNPRKSQRLALVGPVTRSKVPTLSPYTTIAASIRSDPAIVYSSSFSVAPSRPAPPQTPISTYSGISIASKNA